MEDVVDPHAALDEVAHQRNELAERVRVPGWYVAVTVIALSLMFGFHPIARRIASWPRSDLWTTSILMVAIIAFTQWSLVVRLVTGTQLPNNFRRAYPSSRRPFYIMLAIYLLGFVVAEVTGDVTPWAIPIGFGVTFAVATVIAQGRVLAAIRHDIRTGQAVGA